MNTEAAPPWLPLQLVPFFTLSYPTPRPAQPDSFPGSNYYATGLLDGFYIVTAIAVMAVLRDVTRLYVWEPFARWKLTRDLRNSKPNKLVHANGNGKANGAVNGNGHAAQCFITPAEKRKMNRSVMRFAEQGWSVIYYTFSWGFGVYINRNFPTTVLNPINVWTGYPHTPLAGPVKFYYLLQTACYIHQMLVLNAEARRKDHWQMMAHHVITVALEIASYFYNYTRVGCLVLVLMDLCDGLLPLAKMLRYLGMSTLCDLAFVVFMLSWFFTRHVLFMLVIKATWEAWYVIPRVWDPSRGHFLTTEIYYAFFCMLVALQVIQLVWFTQICRVAYRVVAGEGAEDTRSDDEE
ncbi:hypothetical protein V8D89_005798 [Ganoderma adspersum]